MPPKTDTDHPPPAARSTDNAEPNDGTGKSSGSALQAQSPDYQVGAAAMHQVAGARTTTYPLPQLLVAEPKVQNSAFAKADKNHDRILEQSEIEERLTGTGLTAQERGVLSEMSIAFPQLMQLRSGEPGDQRGITRADMSAHHLRRGDAAYAELLKPAADKARILESARAQMPSAQFELFKADMQAFEARLRGNPQELASTYQQIDRLLNPPGGRSVADSKQMTNLAADVMHHAGDPKSIQQGGRNTCTFAALEARMYTRHPSQAARMVADVATAGDYTTADGSVRVSIDNASVATHPEFWRSKIPGEEYESRSHASQIFQVTAANLFIQMEESARGRGERYALREKNGRIEEGLIDQAGNLVSDTPGVTLLDTGLLNQLNNKIAGVIEPDFMIYTDNSRTLEEFRRTWEHLQQGNNFPAVMLFNPLNPPFRKPGAPPQIGTPYHVTAVSPGRSEATIAINDQHGSASDVEVTLETAYRATKFPDEVLTEPQVAITVAKAFVNAGKLATVNASALKLAVHQFTPEQLAVVGQRYRELTGKPLEDFLKRHLPAEDMQILAQMKTR